MSNRGRRRIYLLAFLSMLMLWRAAPLQAQSIDITTFEVATALYDQGNYNQAIQLYEQLVDSGYRDSRLFFNLGNAYYKQGEWGRAILNYRRGLQLAPRDADLRANLALARQQTEDRFQDEPSLLESITQVGNYMTLGEIGVLALLLWFAWSIVALLYRRPRKERQRTALQSSLIGISLLLVIVLLLFFNQLYQRQSRAEAVVVTSEVAVVNRPARNAERAFTLHTGAEIDVIDTRGRWVQLALPGDQLQGWVEDDAVEYVLP